jgi:hypothetical protein
MGQLIEWLKGDTAPNDYVEVSETTPLPVSQPLVTISSKLQVLDHSDMIHPGSIQGRVNLSTTAVELKIGVSQLAGRRSLTIYNDASAVIYVGFNSNVTSADGLQVSSGTSVFFKFDPAEPVTMYGVVDEGTPDIFLMELK